LEGLSRLRDDDYPQEDFLHLDKMPLIDYLRSNGASDEAIELMRLGYFEAYGEGIETASTLQLLREMASFGPGVFRIQGGNDQICAKLAGRLPEPVQHDSPVIAIEQSEAGVRVVVENSGGQHEVMGDYVVVTAPLQVQSKIAFTPALSDLRNAAIREIGGGDATRVYLQTKTRYWEKNGYSGTATTDLPVGSVFHSTASQDGTRGILESFTYEARARHMGSLTKAEQWHEMINGISKVYPGIEEQAEKMTSYDWGKDPWARGGHVAFSVGQIGRFQKALKEPEGRIYFAGDAIGGVSGYSHGAFQSGIDVAAEIERL
jgi:monoamine oxidase